MKVLLSILNTYLHIGFSRNMDEIPLRVTNVSKDQSTVWLNSEPWTVADVLNEFKHVTVGGVLESQVIDL